MHLSYIRSAVLAAIVISLASCRPDDTVMPEIDNTPESKVTPMQLPMVDNVYGALYAIKVKHIFNGVEKNSELASAEFYDIPSNTATATAFVSAGHVTINSIGIYLNEQTNGYDRLATQGEIIQDLNFDEGVAWTMTGDDGIPPGNFAWSPKFGRYFGEFPAEISRGEGLTLTFDESSIEWADSVFVAISAGDKLIVKRYAGFAGTVTIPAEELLQLQACTAKRPGYLQISPAVVGVFPVGGRPTAIVKQTTEIRTVIIK
jgi:hypothetical protein